MKLKFTFFASILSLIVFAQTAPSYYADIDFSLTGNDMKEQLSSLITGTHLHTTSYNELKNIFKESDRDPEVYSNILLIYGSSSSGIHQRSRKWSGSWNREHVYPKSHGKPNLGNSGAGADAHHIRPSDITLNSTRGNYPFIDGTGAAAYKSGSGFYPGNEWKGDVARILMYMYVRYGDKTHPNRVANSSHTYSVDMPDVLLKWNVEDPVSDFEKQRNNVVYEVQGNRNPFIDNPYLATVIWNGPAAQNTWPGSFGDISDDTVPPSVPTNLSFDSSTPTSITFSWTASTDEVGVSGYAVYVDGQQVKTVTANNATVTGLSPNTAYDLQVVAIDYANNRSNISEILVATTQNDDGGNSGATCGTEDFESIVSTGSNPSASSYTYRTWTNNNITWDATNARTDQQIDGKAITIRNGSLKSSEIPGGIGMLKVKTQRKFSGGSGSYRLLINGVDKGEIPYSANAKTHEIYDINVEGPITIELVSDNNNNDRVAFDNLTWTCYSKLAVDDEDIDLGNEFKVYPNPVTNGTFFLEGIDEKTPLYIYNINGQLVKILYSVENKQEVVITNLSPGVYVLVNKDKSIRVLVK